MTKKNIPILVFFLLLVATLSAQDSIETKEKVEHLWYSSDAKTLQTKRIESGIFSAFKNWA